jgi:hypothetical protein
MKEKVRKNKLSFLVLCIMLFSCKENNIKREEKLIDDYHRQAIEIKGDSLYFVSKETVNNFLMKTSTKHSLEEVEINDNISFLDKNGNILYQVTCRDIRKPLIYVDCTNLNTKKEYRTTISVNDYRNITDLYKFDIDTVVIFREIK